MNYYIYFHAGAEPDIAVVEGRTKKEAVERLKLYFRRVSEKDVRKVDCHRKGYVDGLMILGKY